MDQKKKTKKTKIENGIRLIINSNNNFQYQINSTLFKKTLKKKTLFKRKKTFFNMKKKKIMVCKNLKFDIIPPIGFSHQAQYQIEMMPF